MNKRQAKREACWIAARWLQSTLEAGAESFVYDAQGQQRPEEDLVRLDEAMYDIIGELDRRGALRDAPCE